MEANSYLKNIGIYYPGVLNEIKKSSNYLQPVFEAITNSIESINLLKDRETNGMIKIKLYSTRNLFKELEFDKLIIEDSGIGFDNENFNRFQIYKDTRKGFTNRGSGRIQFVHYFNETEFISIYKEGDKFMQRDFILSKDANFLNHDSIIFHKETKEISPTEIKTTLILKNLVENQSSYNSLTLDDLKEKILAHYMLYFCSHKKQMPEILLEHYIGTRRAKKLQIQANEIPSYEKETDISIAYSKIAQDGKRIFKTQNSEIFNVKAFRIPSDKLDKNSIKLTSKNEIVENVKIHLDSLQANDEVDGMRYLFLVSSRYIDNHDSDVRGELKILTEEEFKKLNLFSDEEIILNDITKIVNDNVVLMYAEIKDNAIKHQLEIEKLKSMFLLSDDTLKHLSISLNDNEEKILEKVYAAEAKTVAKQDAEIKGTIDKLDKLNPNSLDYEQELVLAVNSLVKQIPLQNRVALSHYIARRKLVLELFDKILNKKLHIQSSSNRNIDEKLLHNLIFQQSSDNPEKSDLWLVNEDFIYFKGTSESKLGEVKIDGATFFKQNLIAEEDNYRQSLGEDRFAKRPDVLLFPAEGKCIIIEFKNPEVNISDHLNQINKYASWILNFSRDEYRFDTFYGYLIGEQLDSNDVRAADGDFKNSFHFDYVFRPSKTIVGLFGRSDGSLYTEALKYSTLLQRAKKRNEVFIKKLSESSL